MIFLPLSSEVRRFEKNRTIEIPFYSADTCERPQLDLTRMLTDACFSESTGPSAPMT